MASSQRILQLIPKDYIYKYDTNKVLELFTDDLFEVMLQQFPIDATKETFVQQLDTYLNSLSKEEIDDVYQWIRKLMAPRPLTKEEIDFILSLIPLPPGANQEVREFSRKQILDSLRDRLVRIDMTPAAIPELIDSITQKFVRSFIQPGEAVGVNASESISAPITQLTLNTFKHTSGSKKNTGGGLDALKKLVYLSPSASYTTTVEFKSKEMTYQDIYDFRNATSDLRFQDIILNKQIYQTTDIYPTKSPWATLYLTLTEQSIPTTEHMLRIYFNVNKLVEYKISLQDLIPHIMKGTPPSIVVIPSPEAIGILDIYPDENGIRNHTFPAKTPIQFDFMPSLMFLKNILYPGILNKKLSGVTGIKEVYPMSRPVYSIVLEEIKTDKDDEWFLALNYVQMKTTNITKEDLFALLNYVGIDLIYENAQGFLVSMPKESIMNGKYPLPSEYIKRLLDADNKTEDDAEAAAKGRGERGYIHPPTELQKLSKYWYTEVTGDNFFDLIANPNVDPYHTYSNNIKGMFQILGIEAVRNLLISELRTLILNEEYINPRHILLLVDVMTHVGKPIPLNFTGSNLQGKQVITISAFQEAMKALVSAASYGKEDSVHGVAPAVTFGQNVSLGTGLKETKIFTTQAYKEYTEANKVATPITNDLSDTITENFNELQINVQHLPEGKDESSNISNVYNTPLVREASYVKEVPKGTNLPKESITLAPPGVVSPKFENVIQTLNQVNVIGTPIQEQKIETMSEQIESQPDLPSVGSIERVKFTPKPRGMIVNKSTGTQNTLLNLLPKSSKSYSGLENLDLKKNREQYKKFFNQ